MCGIFFAVGLSAKKFSEGACQTSERAMLTSHAETPNYLSVRPKDIIFCVDGQKTRSRSHTHRSSKERTTHRLHHHHHLLHFAHRPWPTDDAYADCRCLYAAAAAANR